MYVRVRTDKSPEFLIKIQTKENQLCDKNVDKYYSVNRASDAARSGIVGPMNIHGYITPGGPVFNFTGTLEEIIPQIQELYPDWNPEVPTPTTSEDPSKVKRYFQHRPTCFQVVGWNTNRAGAYAQAAYLEALGEHTMCGAEARSCARTGCVNGAAVDLCNDRTTKVDITCPRAGRAAKEIANDCLMIHNGEETTRGQWFDTTGYNIVIRECLMDIK
ncbi:uncharacterized protein DFL_004509 [Arthrobotrys flagrans]|uniref:Uncharacterized protein n=1 Tax=Arthrobotrys flagrans TaxID=97331 RepID=A0A437A4T4_ARTFL|nr:hypothetical protein DFL_004509 [Arthrobotrys flagrans]